MTKQYITRHFSFDAGHRIMGHMYKCKSLHGHSYLCDLEFEFDAAIELGYGIDFAEIKRVGVEFVDQYMDHGMLCNPHDAIVIETCENLDSKLWLMSLNGKDADCNPSVENISKEIFLTMMVLFESYQNLRIHKVTIHETPNCFTSCFKESISDEEAFNWMQARYEQVKQFALDKGIVEYDKRKL